MPTSTPAKAAAGKLEEAIAGIIPKCTQMSEALHKLHQLFANTASRIETETTPREQRKSA